jgi:Zn-finger nucleic acid-binding protein
MYISNPWNICEPNMWRFQTILKKHCFFAQNQFISFMKCPTCNIDLVMSERSGIEIDYCPQCRGVWLDRGELDKIIERNAQSNIPPVDPGFGSKDDFRPRKDERRYYDDDDDDYRRKKRKGGLLGEIFDF